VRRADDHGVFVLLDKAMPSRLLTAFPEGVAVERLGLAEVVRRTAEFLNPPALSSGAIKLSSAAGACLSPRSR
jgi:hypothetical protein